MKLIPLTQNQFAMVDDDMFDYLNQWKWGASKKNHTYYAKRSYMKDGKSCVMKMHRLILGLTDPKILGEHRDHNGLNNQRDNLRVCTQQQNVCNKRSQKGSSSKYLGVCRVKYPQKRKNGEVKVYEYWMALIRIKGKQTILGRFKDEKEAALAYNKAAIIHHGEFANPNIL
jgi:hypothetical protein